MREQTKPITRRIDKQQRRHSQIDEISVAQILRFSGPWIKDIQIFKDMLHLFALCSGHRSECDYINVLRRPPADCFDVLDKASIEPLLSFEVSKFSKPRSI